MTDIRDIPIDEIYLFLRGNNQIIPENDNDSYAAARILMRKKGLLFYPPSILEWMRAYNVIKSGNIKNIHNYTVNDVLNMNKNQLEELSEALGLRSTNKYDVINVLNYLHKIVK